MTVTTTAVYVRISQARNGVTHGVDNQEAACREYAKRQGWKIGPVLMDNDKSAYSGKKRPDYERLLELMRAGAVDRVIAWHSDRLHRSLKELETYIDASNAHGIETHFVQAGRFDLTTASGRMNARMVGVVAQAESEHKAERMRLAQRNLVEAGKWIGGTRPFGWQVNENGRAVIDEREAKIVRAATKKVLEGKSLGGIIRAWNDAGITTSTGKQWSYATLRQMLVRSRNAGFVTYSEGNDQEPAGKGAKPTKQRVTEGAWPAILDEADWRAVCALLGDPERRRSTTNRAKWLLAGIARCECGEPVRSAAVGTGSGSTVPIYRCRARGKGHVGRRAREADELVEKTLLAFLEKPENLRTLREGHQSEKSSEELSSKARAIRGRLNDAASMFAANEITAAQFRIVNAELLPQLEGLEARMTATNGTGALAAFFSGVEGPREVWARMDVEGRRAAVAALFDVTFLRTNRSAGRVFDTSTVVIARKQQKAAAGTKLARQP
jgi:site-specific DNA recombinase